MSIRDWALTNLIQDVSPPGVAYSLLPSSFLKLLYFSAAQVRKHPARDTTIADAFFAEMAIVEAM